jgi:hypothetical protein
MLELDVPCRFLERRCQAIYAIARQPRQANAIQRFLRLIYTPIGKTNLFQSSSPDEKITRLSALSIGIWERLRPIQLILYQRSGIGTLPATASAATHALIANMAALPFWSSTSRRRSVTLTPRGFHPRSPVKPPG